MACTYFLQIPNYFLPVVANVNCDCKEVLCGTSLSRGARAMFADCARTVFKGYNQSLRFVCMFLCMFAAGIPFKNELNG